MNPRFYLYLAMFLSLFGLVSMCIGAYLFDTHYPITKGQVFITPFIFIMLAATAACLGYLTSKRH